MATQFYYFSGKAKWAKLGLGLNPEENADKEYECWKLNFYPDEPSMQAYNDSGLRLQVKEDDDGKFVSLRRPFKKLIKEEVVNFDKPPVTVRNPDGTTSPLQTLLGNGSDVVVKVAVYDSRKGKAHRLESVMVTNHVPYEGGANLVVGNQEIVPF
jgi:hypothetical protein